MEYLQKCFFKSTNWNEDNLFSNITATSQAILEFPTPNGCKLDISSQSTEHLASSFTLSNYHSINGSLAYLYSSIPLTNTIGTRDISLQDAIAGFKIIEPVVSLPNANRIYKGSKDLLMYGRMYFPGSALEAMIIKRVSQQTQFLIKCINNPQVKNNGTMIFYLQNNSPRLLREFIYSTNEALCGFRCLYNFTNAKENSTKYLSNPLLIPKFDNSVLSVGLEMWYAALTMSPGLSTAFRYSTRSTSTGKPLTMTLACNPILGHISSTYTVKTSVASTFSSKYDFNFFSYASNLSVGFELFNYSNSGRYTTNMKTPINYTTNSNKEEYRRDPNDRTEIIPLKTSTYLNHNASSNIINPIQNLDNYYHINPTFFGETDNLDEDTPQLSRKVPVQSNNGTIMTAFQHLVNESDFSSVVKCSTSLNNRVLKVLWEGKFKDFLVSTGIKIGLNPSTNIPECNRVGITLSYSC